MITIFHQIDQLTIQLESFIEADKIKDYRIILRINNLIDVYVLDAVDNKIILPKCRIEFITSGDLKEDQYNQELFNSDKKQILDSRRSLNNLLAEDIDQKKLKQTKIITFYSYKGGVGRSTSLASCASFLAYHYSKKIVIVDCDFEAPGFTNFYLDHPNEINHSNGLIEYLTNKKSDENTLVSDYITEIGVEYSGSGSIFVMKAGNLSDEKISDIESISTPKKQYLQALSRIQISNRNESETSFFNLFSEIEKEINPDIIMVDSRTGFNDVFGLMALNFSDVVVGFFGDNVQTNPGLEFFIENVGFSKNNINSVIVNSIISNRSSFSKFQQKLDTNILRLNSEKRSDEFNEIAIKAFPIVRYSTLEFIGVAEDSKQEFIDLISNKRFPEYNELFEYINTLCESNTFEDFIEIPSIPSEEDQKSFLERINDKLGHFLSLELKNAHSYIRELTVDENHNIQRNLKKHIKTKLRQEYPKLYGEHSTNEMLRSIYYRKSMEDIFNHSKFLLLGNKGTGKTFLYEALKIEEVVKKIQHKAQKKENYIFLHLIDNDSDKFIDTLLFDDVDQKSESFYHKFWIVYIWNSIMLEIHLKLGFTSEFEVLPIHNNSITRARFIEFIENEKQLIKIENELKELDNYLKRSDKKQNLVVIFDGLDQIVKPSNWHYKIVPLINYWRNHSFSKISPKLFLRSDLFEKLSNITNIKELKNQSISIEWNQQELFAYFFKLILKTSDDAFLKYMLFTKYISFELIKQIHQKSGEDNQIPLDESYLKPMVETFFGKFADSKNSPRYGESYDWFFRNLKNANNTISLRPFIDLLDNSLDYSSSSDNSKYPILPANYFVHGEARKNALSNHFDDLVKEKGNEDLEIICKYIREKKNIHHISLTNSKSDFDKLLKEIIDNNNTENKTVDQLINVLKLNGVISEQFTSKGISYSFALLYKYYLGLKSK